MADENADNPTPPPTPPQGDTPTTPASRKAFTPSAETRAGDDPTKNKKKEKPEPTTFGGKLWFNWVKPIGSVVIVVVLIRSTLIDWNDVPTGSMEPEIHVGDRIAVNRLAYALQAPLTGPTIGIPFTPIQFDNPLDGIPQLQWGAPDRGDIVTFWNPITDVRMVKRIVAVPGDTIEMRNSVMIINGTAATYEDVDAAAEGLEPVTRFKNEDNAVITKDVTYRRETLLDEVRITQHIEERWASAQIAAGPIIGLQAIREGTVLVPSGGELSQALFENYLRNEPRAKVLAELADGELFVDGQPASYNDAAEAMFERLQGTAALEVMNKIGLGMKGDQLMVDGEAATSEVFFTALRDRIDKLSKSEQFIARPCLDAAGFLRTSLTTNFGPLTLDKREYFMVGDNRNNSSDGRFFGPVDIGEITGEAFAVAFSFENNKMFALPPDPAWDRFFKDLD